MFPLTLIFNILVALIFFAYWVMVFVTTYHLSRFGIGVQPKKFSVIFLFLATTFFSIALILYINLDVDLIVTMLT